MSSRFRGEPSSLVSRPIQSERGNERGFAGAGILAGGLADQLHLAFGVEQILRKLGLPAAKELPSLKQVAELPDPLVLPDMADARSHNGA